MAAATHVFYAGVYKPITTTGRKTILPNGNPAGDKSGVIGKTGSVVNGR